MNHRSLALLGALATTLSLQGCYWVWGDSDSPTPSPPLYLDPDDAPATLEFTLSRGCAGFASGPCPSTRPLMAGVRENASFSVPGNAYGPSPSVRVDDPAVLTVGALTRLSEEGRPYRGTFEVIAGSAPGSTTVTIANADGRSWQYVLRVEAAAGMDIVEDEGSGHLDRVQGTLRLRVGEQVSLTGVPVSAEVERLYANDVVIWTVPNTRVVNLSRSFMSGPRVADDHVYVQGRAAGTEEITVRAGVVERSIQVTVTP